MTFRPELIDELPKEYRNPEDLMGEGGIFKQLTKALIERCLSAELDTHLAEEKLEPEPECPRNRHNGHSKKTIIGILRRVIWEKGFEEELYIGGGRFKKCVEAGGAVRIV